MSRINVMVLKACHRREAVLIQLREPGPEADRLISTLLGLDEKAWTRDFSLAESLVPMKAVYTLSHNDDRSFYWCDVSDGTLNVQGWGRTPACAIAAAGLTYLMDSRNDSTGDSRWRVRHQPRPPGKIH